MERISIITPIIFNTVFFKLTNTIPSILIISNILITNIKYLVGKTLILRIKNNSTTSKTISIILIIFNLLNFLFEFCFFSFYSYYHHPLTSLCASFF